ncbi:hypothetical protein [uncultured Roseobacter sp.]|uniref:hypothetical protein n=1 Tax=uncultured Roseobacter sp. TaxID=114847 RepID=UPI0026391731|nr:hypothetical protein [uncultured Roseobacter sp.]
MTKGAIILVHGVGPAEAGSTIKSLLSGPVNSHESCVFDTLQLGQHSYTRGSLPGGPDLYESNWSELRPLKSTGPLLLLEVLVLLFSMLKASSIKKYAGEDNSRWYPGFAYYRSFIWGLFWCIHPAIVAMFLVVGSSFAAIAWISLLFGVAWILSRYDKSFRSGFVWCIAMLAMAAGFVWGEFPAEFMVCIATLVYLVAQGIAMAFGLIAMAAVVVMSSQSSFRQTLVRLAFVYVPFLVASCVGSVVWLLALVPATSGGTKIDGKFGGWANLYAESLPYEIYSAERFNGLLVLTCGLLLLLPAVVLIFKTWRKDQNAAVLARNTLNWSLVFIPVVLVLALPAFLWLVPFCKEQVECTGADVWSAYATWSVRFYSFLPFLFGGLGLVLKATGDVLLYLSPQSDLIRTRSIAVEKLTKLVEHLRSGGHRVLLLCHSQGTVIGLDVVKEFPMELGVWISGSPVDALYHDFLGLDRITTIQVNEFRNYYRYDDPIGGVVRTKPGWEGNIAVGWGGHTNYWPMFNVSDLREALLRI